MTLLAAPAEAAGGSMQAQKTLMTGLGGTTAGVRTRQGVRPEMK